MILVKEKSIKNILDDFMGQNNPMSWSAIGMPCEEEVTVSRLI